MKNKLKSFAKQEIKNITTIKGGANIKRSRVKVRPNGLPSPAPAPTPEPVDIEGMYKLW